MEKLLFLDIDGVLVTKSSMRKAVREMGDSFDIREHEHLFFDVKLVGNLNIILDKTNAKIVISSAWRVGRSLRSIKDLFKRLEVRGSIIGATDIKGKFRGQEIQRFLDGRDGLETMFVIIDDNVSGIRSFFPDNVIVETDWSEGLTEQKAEEAIQKLER